MENRRKFLQISAAALTAAAAKPLLGYGVQGANNRIRMGIIGAGNRGGRVFDSLVRHADCQFLATAEVNKAKLDQWMTPARQTFNLQVFGDYRRILDRRDIDAVLIATPDHWHSQQTIDAIAAGKDVYVEKPACVAIDEGLTMVAAARKYNRIVQAGTWQRSGAHFQQACEMVRNGTLGKVAFVRTWIYSNQPQQGIGNPPDGNPPLGLDWDLWLGPAPARKFNPNRFGVYPKAYSYFRHFWDYAGGQLTDSGVHMIDVLHMAFSEAMPRSIVALGGKYWFQDDTETPDTMQVTYEYPGFLGSWEHRSNNTENQQGRLMGITFHGTRGTLYVDRTLYRLTPEKGSDLQASEMKRVTDPHPLHWTNFVDCVRTRQKPNSEIETCFRSSAACILGNLSLRARMRLDWDDKRQTVLQSEAQRYLRGNNSTSWKVTL
jgi:predicted dehydrogenase